MTSSNQNRRQDQTILDGYPLLQYLTYRLSRVQSKLNAQGAKILGDAVGLTLMQWRVIALIGIAGQTRFSTLAKDAVFDKGFLSRNLKALIEDGLVLSEPDELDQRAQNLRLSEEGQKIFERALPVTRKRQDWLIENLTPDEITTFRRVLDKLEIAAERLDF